MKGKLSFGVIWACIGSALYWNILGHSPQLASELLWTGVTSFAILAWLLASGYYRVLLGKKVSKRI